MSQPDTIPPHDALPHVPVIVSGAYPARPGNLVPLHSDFGRLTVPWFQYGQVGTINQDSDIPGHPRAARD
jgi:hypothetical protein